LFKAIYFSQPCGNTGPISQIKIMNTTPNDFTKFDETYQSSGQIQCSMLTGFVEIPPICSIFFSDFSVVF